MYKFQVKSLKFNHFCIKRLLTHVIQMWDGIGVKDREYFNNGENADIPEIETITEVWYDNPVNYVIIIGVIAFIFLLGKELIK